MVSLTRIAQFLRLIDESGNLDLIDLSFMGTMGKILFTPGIDYTAVCAMVPVILAKMHRSHISRTPADKAYVTTDATLVCPRDKHPAKKKVNDK